MPDFKNHRNIKNNILHNQYLDKEIKYNYYNYKYYVESLIKYDPPVDIDYIRPRLKTIERKSSNSEIDPWEVDLAWIPSSNNVGRIDNTYFTPQDIKPEDTKWKHEQKTVAQNSKVQNNSRPRLKAIEHNSPRIKGNHRGVDLNSITSSNELCSIKPIGNTYATLPKIELEKEKLLIAQQMQIIKKNSHLIQNNLLSKDIISKDKLLPNLNKYKLRNYKPIYKISYKNINRNMLNIQSFRGYLEMQSLAERR